MRRVLVAAIWAASLLTAWFVGTRMESAVRERAGASPSAGGRAGYERAAELFGESGRAPGETSRLPPPDLSGATDLAEIGARLQPYLDQEFARGQAGHVAILRVLDAAIRPDGAELRLVLEDASDDVRHAFPWFPLLARDRREIASLVETLLVSLGRDGTPVMRPRGAARLLDVVTAWAPAMVGASTRARWEGKLERIAEEAAEPEVAEAAYAALGRWRPGHADEALLARLADPQLAPEDALAALDRIAPEEARQLDLARLLAPALRDGNYRVFATLFRIQPDASLATELDPLVLEAFCANKYGSGAIWRYLLATGRRSWRDAVPFIEQGLALPEPIGERFAYSLALLAEEPDREFVRWIRGNERIPARTRTWIASRFAAGGGR